MKNLFWFLKKGLLAAIILAVLYAAALYLVRRPCDNLFPPLDRSYDFTLELGGRTLQGNTGSKLDYLLLYLTKLAPDGLNFSVDFYGGTYQGNSGGLIDNFILMDGAFEKSVLYFMRDVMQVLAPGNGVFMDIGANTGQHSLYMAQYSREVHAFEPYEPVLKRFRHMIEINGLENIVVHAVGLGEADEKLPFFEPPAENPGTGSFVDGFKNYNTFTSAEFRIVRGDDWLAGIGQPVVHLIKLDVEGYEQPVLKGLRETLVRHRPVIVVGDQLWEHSQLPEQRRTALGPASGLCLSGDADGPVGLVPWPLRTGRLRGGVWRVGNAGPPGSFSRGTEGPNPHLQLL